MSLKTTSVRLNDEAKKYVAREEWFLLEVEKGVNAAEERCLTDHKDIKTRWEVKRAVQMD